MVFRPALTFADPASSQSGFPAPGTGAQTTGPAKPLGRETPWVALYPTKGLPTYATPGAPGDAQRGFPSPANQGTQRPPEIQPAVQEPFGGVTQVYTPPYDRGAAAYVPNFGLLLTNPIGAGIAANYRPQASYGGAAQYDNGMLFWTSQVIPTSVNLQGLTSPEELATLLNSLQVQAVVRTTG